MLPNKNPKKNKGLIILRCTPDNLSTLHSEKLENRWTFEEREAIENSPSVFH
jgi:hypothetical protein